MRRRTASQTPDPSFDSNFEPIPQPKVADVRAVKFGDFSNSGFDFTD